MGRFCRALNKDVEAADNYASLLPERVASMQGRSIIPRNTTPMMRECMRKKSRFRGRR